MDKEVKANRGSEEIEINLVDIFGVLLHWIWLIALVALIAGGIGYCVSRFVLPEEFNSTTKVYVLNRSNQNSDNPTYQDMQVSTQLTKDYSAMITSRYVLEKVIDNLDLPYSYSKLKSQVSVTTPSDSRIIQITVTDEDPTRAQAVCREVRDVSSEHIQKVMAIDAINLVDDANLPTRKSAPNNTRNAILCAIAGALLVSVIVVVRYLMDDTLKTSEDVEKYLNMSCLAIIPLDQGVAIADPEEHKHRHKKKSEKD